MRPQAAHPRPDAAPPPGIAAAVLIGGGSSRMGRDKAGVVVDGRSLLTRTLDTLGEVAGSITLVGRDAPPLPTRGDDATDPGPDPAPAARPAAPPHTPPVTPRTGVRTVPDARPDGGPLVGLETALRAHPGTDAVLVVGIDHPWLQVHVLQELVARLLASPGSDAAMLVTDRGAQPLLAAYRPDALAAVSDLLDTGERRLRVVADHLDVVRVEPADWRRFDAFGLTAVDVDTPEELARAVRWQGRLRATRTRASGPVGQGTPTQPVTRVAGGRTRALDDTVIGEEPLELRAGGPGQVPIVLMTTLRTPGHEREQAVGWLLAEGFATPEQLVEVRLGDPLELARPEDTVTVTLTRTVDPSVAARRHAMATASCGVCGRASIDELAARTAPVTGDAFRASPLAWPRLAGLPQQLRHAQPRFAATGGVHATGLFDGDGRLVTVREDVGRHNALDAAIGAHVLGGSWPPGGLDDLVCVLSGRIGFELVAKAAVARLPIVAAVGAASELAVRTADRLGITLVGFVRDGNGTVYTHPERLVLP